MRPIKREQVELVKELTRKFIHTHGEPIYCGLDCHQILGVNNDLEKVDFGDSVTINVQDEILYFWHFGVTAIQAAINAKTDVCITHAPGHMFVTDVKDDLPTVN
ncbi:unnamed protein product [Didymodactylos carnosus]|uniref:Uncharacterized protein n=1 Tax=Didymodactylos carnosus TaxID=1234261 RepID=A0A815ENS5_9BILA|nr:unnamed protein product [Didymodactylos carnosus]CAF4144758.1 unnamed protein product [Didymodactylos carnosus]